MNIRTGKMYTDRDEAIADGVPESDVAEVKWTREGPDPKFTNPKYPERHQGMKEMERRVKLLEENLRKNNSELPVYVKPEGSQ